MRFYDVSRGRVLSMRRITRDSTWPNFGACSGLVLQDVHVFSGTIAAIPSRRSRTSTTSACGRPPTRCTRTAHRAVAAGFDTAVAERGATLSTGRTAPVICSQRSRSIRGPHLDEATSSVDTRNGAVDPGRAARADGWPHIHRHRASVVDHSGRGQDPRPGKGPVAESGTHQELLALRGIYYRLYQLQYKDQERLPDRLPGIRPWWSLPLTGVGNRDSVTLCELVIPNRESPIPSPQPRTPNLNPDHLFTIRMSPLNEVSCSQGGSSPKVPWTDCRIRRPRPEGVSPPNFDVSTSSLDTLR